MIENKELKKTRPCCTLLIKEKIKQNVKDYIKKFRNDLVKKNLGSKEERKYISEKVLLAEDTKDLPEEHILAYKRLVCQLDIEEANIGDLDFGDGLYLDITGREDVERGITGMQQGGNPELRSNSCKNNNDGVSFKNYQFNSERLRYKKLLNHVYNELSKKPYLGIKKQDIIYLMDENKNKDEEYLKKKNKSYFYNTNQLGGGWIRDSIGYSDYSYLKKDIEDNIIPFIRDIEFGPVYSEAGVIAKISCTSPYNKILDSMDEIIDKLLDDLKINKNILDNETQHILDKYDSDAKQFSTKIFEEGEPKLVNKNDRKVVSGFSSQYKCNVLNANVVDTKIRNLWPSGSQKSTNLNTNLKKKYILDILNNKDQSSPEGLQKCLPSSYNTTIQNIMSKYNSEQYFVQANMFKNISDDGNDEYKENILSDSINNILVIFKYIQDYVSDITDGKNNIFVSSSIYGGETANYYENKIPVFYIDIIRLLINPISKIWFKKADGTKLVNTGARLSLLPINSWEEYLGFITTPMLFQIEGAEKDVKKGGISIIREYI
jgi:hypothetical protein